MVLSFTGRQVGKSVLSTPERAPDRQPAIRTGPARRGRELSARPRCEILHNGKTTKMNGELIEDPATVADLSHRCAESYGVKQAQRMMGLAFRDQRIPTVEEFKEAAEREHLVAVRLTPA